MNGIAPERADTEVDDVISYVNDVLGFLGLEETDFEAVEQIAIEAREQGASVKTAAVEVLRYLGADAAFVDAFAISIGA